MAMEFEFSEQEVVEQDATRLAELIAAGELSSEEVVRAHLNRIDEIGDRVNAFVTLAAERALEDARRTRPGIRGRTGAASHRSWYRRA